MKEHTYLWENIPKDLWDQAQRKAGSMPMKWVLVRLLEDYVKGADQKATTMPQERRTRQRPPKMVASASSPQPEPVVSPAEDSGDVPELF